MSSWVRYSVAVYLGLLISGALARPPMYAPASPSTNAPSVYHQVPTPANTLPTAPCPAKRDDANRSV